MLEMVFVSWPSKKPRGRAQKLGCELKAGANCTDTGRELVTAHAKWLRLLHGRNAFSMSLSSDHGVPGAILCHPVKPVQGTRENGL